MALAGLALATFGLPAAPASGAPASAKVDMRSVRFEPQEVAVAVGGTVTWTNHDPQTHQVTANNGSFSSGPCRAGAGPGCIPTGKSYSETFGQAGRIPYYCSTHGGPNRGMTGVVVVG